MPTSDQHAFICEQAPGCGVLSLDTDSVARDDATVRATRVRPVRAPMTAPYGTLAAFLDLVGAV